jgi:hypothetical protein
MLIASFSGMKNVKRRIPGAENSDERILSTEAGVNETHLVSMQSGLKWSSHALVVFEIRGTLAVIAQFEDLAEDEHRERWREKFREDH